MLHRTKKLSDPNEGKWIGVGGHQEEDETPAECLIREVHEETGIELKEGDWQFRGIVTFVSDEWESELMFLYTARTGSREVSECNEGELRWISKDEIMDLSLWEGDRIFLKKLIDGDPFFNLKLVYEGDRLVDHYEA